MTANVNKWSKTAATNATADGDIGWAEGQAPSTVNNSARAMMQGVANWRDDTGGQLTLAGGTTVYTATTNSVNTAPTLIDGLRIHAVVNVANTGATTLNIDGLGAKNVYKSSSSGITAIGSGDLTVDQHCIFEYDASLNAAAGGWVLLNALPPAAAAGVLLSWDTVADANQTMAAGKIAYTWTTLTVSRTATLLAATGYTAGQQILIEDGSGSSTPAVLITAIVNPAPGTDTIVGASTVNSANGRLFLICDGVSKFYGYRLPSVGTAAGQLVALDSAAKLPAVDGSQLTNISNALWPAGYLTGLTISRATATTFGIATGAARNEDGGTAYNMTLASAFTKALTAWAVGTGNGGIDTGAVANTTWYHVHLIRKDSDGSIDILYSLSVSAPTMPAGYTARRRIGSFLTNGSAQIVTFIQNGDTFTWDIPVGDVNATNPGTAAVTRTLTVPTGVVVFPIVNWHIANVTSALIFFLVTPLSITDTTPSATLFTGKTPNLVNAGAAGKTTDVFTNTSGQVRSRQHVSGGSDVFTGSTQGWVDPRGK